MPIVPSFIGAKRANMLLFFDRQDSDISLFTTGSSSLICRLGSVAEVVEHLLDKQVSSSNSSTTK
jgi:hypothetical protein